MIQNYEIFGQTIRNVTAVQHEINEMISNGINDCQMQLQETEGELMNSNHLLQVAYEIEAEKYALWQAALAELEAALASMDAGWIASATAREEYARAEYQMAVRHREDMQRRVSMAEQCVRMANARLEETRSVYASYRSQLDETVQVQFGRLAQADERIKNYLNVNQPAATTGQSTDGSGTNGGIPQGGLSKEQKSRIKKETGWSDEIIDRIQNWEQYEIYKNAGLHEENVNGRPCLLKDIDMDYIDEKTGMSNRELMEKGRSPIDAKTGEKIELHHIGQEFDSPFAELCENSEHGDGNHRTLHTKNEDSWRNDQDQYNQYQREKKEHWKTRAQEGA